MADPWPLGAKLIAAYRRRYDADQVDIRDILVTKVGRKWATFVDAEKPNLKHLGGRFDVETWEIDGRDYGSPGKVYRDAADREEAIKLDAAWKEVARQMPWIRPRDAEAADIARLRSLLRIPRATK